MITIKQISKFQREAKADGIARLEILAVEAIAAIDTYGQSELSANTPSVKMVSREFVARTAIRLGHNMARQNASCECSRCGKSGAVADTDKGIVLSGAIFTERCGE